MTENALHYFYGTPRSENLQGSHSQSGATMAADFRQYQANQQVPPDVLTPENIGMMQRYFYPFVGGVVASAVAYGSQRTRGGLPAGI
jgi:hypothetical protein